MSNEQKYVYIMSNDFGLYKIGISKDVNKRCAQIKNNGGVPTKVEYSYLPSTCIALELERTLHLKYKDYRKIGEWFELEDISEVIKDIESEFINENCKSKTIEERREELRYSFTTLPNELVYDKDITHMDIRVYFLLYNDYTMFLRSASVKFGLGFECTSVFHKTQETLCKEINISKAKLNESISRLERKGHLIRIPFSVGGRQRVNIVVFNKHLESYQSTVNRCFEVLTSKVKKGGKRCIRSLKILNKTHKHIPKHCIK